MTTSPDGLARKSVGVAGLSFLAMTASAPMTVLAGSVVATFAATGVLGVPLAFGLLMVPLLLVSIGLVTFSRQVSHTAALYAFLAHGLGRVAGVGGAAVAVLAYNAIQISLYGLFGAVVAGVLGGTWWTWALAAWAVVGLLGVRHIQLNTRVLAVVLLVEVAVIALFTAGALAQPADPATLLTPLQPDRLLVDGLGGVLAFTVAAFIGFESVVVYREEARDHRAVHRASLATLVLLGVLYTLASWALTVAVGADRVVDTTRDPDAALPFSLLADYFGPLMFACGFAVLLLSVFGAMLSFHNVVARYVHGLAREGVLPGPWAAIGGSAGGVPVGGSLAQTATAFVTIALFALTGADPITVMFTLLSALAALGVLLLMVAASVAVIAYYWRRRRTDRPTRWRWLAAPALGGAALAAILAVTVLNISTLTAQALPEWALPVIVAASAILGLIWGAVLRSARPDIYAAIGRGQPKPLAVIDRELASLEL